MQWAGMSEEQGFMQTPCFGAKQELDLAGVTLIAGLGKLDFRGYAQAIRGAVANDSAEFHDAITGLEWMAGMQLCSEALHLFCGGFALRAGCCGLPFFRLKQLAP